MRRLVLACAASLVLYAALFGFLLDRPLAYGFLSAQLDAKLARAEAISGPKLVILAGSNGPYSHRCEVIEHLLNRPCVNGGVAVGIGLDYLFTRWRPLLRPGDIVYLPMEEAQYVRPRAATAIGPDAAIMFRHDWRTLARLDPGRWLGALFAFDLRYSVMAMIEQGLVLAGFHDPRPAAEGGMNAWGDHVGHTPALGADSQDVLALARPVHPSAIMVARSEGSAEIARFLRWARANFVRAIGGWPTHFADSPIPPETGDAIRTLFLENGAGFLDVRSSYPRSAFFDTPDHLSEPWQIAHSVEVADGLSRIIGAFPAVTEMPERTRWPARAAGQPFRGIIIVRRDQSADCFQISKSLRTYIGPLDLLLPAWPVTMADSGSLGFALDRRFYDERQPEP
jgi:hypothetical protein